MVTDIVQSVITYENNEWIVKEANPEKDITKYNRSRKRFNFYPWGIYCTAYSRRNLWLGIMNFKQDYIYSDTDSIKCLNIDKHMNFINKYNEMCEKKLRLMCKHYHIDYEELLPKTIKGEVKPLGVWDWETKNNKYTSFKTLGAKRYMVLQDGKLSITVSGVNKKVAVPYLLEKYGSIECFNAFNDGLEIPPDYTGKLTHYYIDIPYTGVVVDYLGVPFNYNELSGVYLEKAAYSFDISTEYINFLKGYFYTK